MRLCNGSFVFATCCCLSAHPVAGQDPSVGSTINHSVDTGPSIGSIGARISVRTFQFGDFSAGLEFGYAKLADVPSTMSMSDHAFNGMVEWESAIRKMYHAAFNARRTLFEQGDAGLYVGAGSGLYYFRSRAEYWEPRGGNHDVLAYRTDRVDEFRIGLSLGSGIEFRPHRAIPGAVDLDARLHVLPFSGTGGVRSVFIMSAGLRIF